MRNSLLVMTLVLSGVLIAMAPSDYPSEVNASGGDSVYRCNTIEDLYSESNLVIRGKPFNIEIFYQNTPGALYQIEVIEVLKGKCGEVIEVKTSNDGFANKHPPILSDKELEQCEVILFLSKNTLHTKVVDINRGFFFVYGNSVYSIGVIDEDYQSLTTGLQNNYCLDDFR